VGLGYAVIGFLLGEVIGHADVDATHISPLKPAVIAAFVTVFGGSGLLFMMVVPPLFALPLAALCGAAVAFLIYRFIVVPLSRAQNTTAIEIQSLIGQRAKVTEGIPQGQYGKITYKVNDSIYTAPAKSQDGSEIARNTDVEIVYIENNAYFVRLV
jgi:membrane protein implicated in regulation of membrane protease activity